MLRFVGDPEKLLRIILFHAGEKLFKHRRLFLAIPQFPQHRMAQAFAQDERERVVHLGRNDSGRSEVPPVAKDVLKRP